MIKKTIFIIIMVIILCMLVGCKEDNSDMKLDVECVNPQSKEVVFNKTIIIPRIYKTNIFAPLPEFHYPKDLICTKTITFEEKNGESK